MLKNQNPETKKPEKQTNPPKQKRPSRNYAIVQDGKIRVTDAAAAEVREGRARYATVADCGAAGVKIHPKYIYSNTSKET